MSGGIILLFLAIVAGGVLLKQSRFDEGVFFGTLPQKSGERRETPSGNENSPLSSINAPGGFEPMGEWESFDETTLSNKINGKAELYLEAGFQSLRSRRFAGIDNPGGWFELYLYRMNSPEAAFSAFSLQKRSERQSVGETTLAYSTENALFFVFDSHYVEIVASDVSPELSFAMKETARNIHPPFPDIRLSLPHFTLLPKEGRIPGSEKLHMKNAFGFELFQEVITADFNIDGGKVTAFALEAPVSKKALELAGDYHRFLLKLGAENMVLEQGTSSFFLADVIGDIELVSAEREYVFGVHAASSREFALEMAGRIEKHISTIKQEAPSGGNEE